MIKLSGGGYLQENIATITTVAGAVTTDYIYFPSSFARTPTITVIPPFGAEGTYASSSVDTQKFKITVTGETAANMLAATFKVQWLAAERPLS